MLPDLYICPLCQIQNHCYNDPPLLMWVCCISQVCLGKKEGWESITFFSEKNMKLGRSGFQSFAGHSQAYLTLENYLSFWTEWSSSVKWDKNYLLWFSWVLNDIKYIKYLAFGKYSIYVSSFYFYLVLLLMTHNPSSWNCSWD